MTRKAAEAALAAGDLDTCRTALFDAVRQDPGDLSLRAFLFQFCALIGDWERAAKQLAVIGELKADRLDFVTDYQAAVAAEQVRAAFWAGKISPTVFGEPRQWIAELIQAQRHEAAGEAEAAHDLRAKALDAAPANPGRTDQGPFAWIADADTRLGPVCEMVLDGEYHWVAFADIARLEISPPKDLRDLVWTPAMLTLANGGAFPVFLPARYPGTVETGDPQLLMGRKTDFRALHGEHAAGLGQRMFATDSADLPLLELRELTFDATMEALLADAQPEDAGADGPADG